jgi:hypothetical protein
MPYKHFSSLRFAAGLAAVFAAHAAASPVYTFNTFTVGGPAAFASHVTGINNAGDVTGYYSLTVGYSTGFILTSGGTLTPIDPANTYHDVEAFGINNSDTVAGWNDYVYNGYNSTDEGFVEPSGGAAAYATGPGTPPRSTYGYGLNDSGVLVGTYTTSYGHYGYTWDGTTLTTFADPGLAGSTFATGINDSGQTVGYYTVGGVLHGFLRNTDGTYVNIDDPLGSHGTEPQAINSRGDIAGYYLDSANLIHGFVYIASSHSFETIDLGGGTATYISGINDSDQISGSFRQTSISDYTDFIGTASSTSATPEPGGFLLLAGGLIAMGVLRRRRSDQISPALRSRSR